ncbi:MAG: hypothetical protein EOP08_11575 [Proteobacteria bacterium]|nr:MAG: hypothetical protein EOP08_11575 [Pseudomonadota bacterium]
MAAQLAFSVVPLIHTAQRERALIVGLGTGTSARILHEAGFVHAEVAELSADVLGMARRHFSTINHGVLGSGIASDPVQAHVTDGRNFLLLSKDRYDLIGIELTSIWFAGAASLYNREFYRLLASRLAPGGILQQWLQLHRLDQDDIRSVVGTLRETFPEVYLYFVGNQGVLIACGRDSTGLTGRGCAPTEATRRTLFDNPQLQDALGYFEHSPEKLLASRLLAPHEIEELVRPPWGRVGKGNGRPCARVKSCVQVEHGLTVLRKRKIVRQMVLPTATTLQLSKESIWRFNSPMMSCKRIRF